MSESLSSDTTGGWKSTRFNVSTADRDPLPAETVGGTDSVSRPETTNGGPDAGPSPSLNSQANRDTSRFRIEFVDENTDDSGGRPQDNDDDDGRHGTTGNGGNTNGHGGGHYSSYDTTQGQKTFGRNTLETLPHVDHYRNLLSATGVIRKRPTLLELHELDVAVSVGFIKTYAHSWDLIISL